MPPGLYFVEATRNSWARRLSTACACASPCMTTQKLFVPCMIVLDAGNEPAPSSLPESLEAAHINSVRGVLTQQTIEELAERVESMQVGGLVLSQHVTQCTASTEQKSVGNPQCALSMHAGAHCAPPFLKPIQSSEHQAVSNPTYQSFVDDRVMCSHSRGSVHPAPVPLAVF